MMKKFFTRFLAALALLVGLAIPMGMRGQAPVNTVLWEETWTGGTSGETPSEYGFEGTTVYGGATLTYEQNDTGTKLYNETYAGGTAPELLLKSGKTWTISNIPTGQATELTLTYKSNNTKSSVTCSTPGASISGSSKSYTITVGENSTLTLVFGCSGNTRIDDVVLKVKTAGSGGSTPVNPTITFNDGNVNVGKTLDLNTLFSSNSTGAVSYSITSGSSYASITDNVITGVAVGSVTVEASQAATASYNAATATATITVNAAPALSSIAITTPPTKTTYVVGETFDPTGMVVTATYSDASTDVVTSLCTWTPDGALTTSDTEIEVSYTENAVTMTASQSITVITQLTNFDIALNNTAFGCNTGNNAVEQSFTINNTVIVAGCASNAQNKTYYDTDHVRFYADSYLKITSPSGYKITKTIFTAKGTWNGSISANTGTYTNSTKTWEGETDQLDFSFAAQNRIASIEITLSLPSSIAAPTFTPEAGTYATAQSVTISTTTTGANIYYTLDGTTPTSSSTPYSSPVSVGETMTIKAIAVLGSDESTVASATYTILPIEHAGTEADPYTVADARNAIDVYGTKDDAYVSGIISQVDGYDSEHQSITYWISDDGTTTNQLEVYSGKGLNGADFSSVNDVLVGAVVTVKGQLKKYNDVYEFNYNNQLVEYEYTAPADPSVTPTTFLIEATATSNLSGTLTVTYANIDEVAAHVWFCNAAGTETATYDWITTNVNSENNIEYQITENTGDARTAYFKVWANDNNSTAVYSDLVTVTQAAPVVDYATLPFIWAGGPSSSLNNENGVTVNSASTDYADQNAPYLIKFNDDGYYINVHTDEQPVAVSVSVKKFTNASSSSNLVIEESSNGTDYTTVQSFATGGAQNSISTYVTTNSFNAESRYVRIYFERPSSGGANVGVGPITIKGIETYSLNNITGYSGEKDHYYLIASPVTVNPENVVDMTTGTYDLYYFDQSEVGAEWQNYEVFSFNLVPGKGYLYANQSNVNLTFTGTPYVGNGEIDLNYDDNANFKGWNLIGNPFGISATLSLPYYRLNEYGSALETETENTSVAAMEGVFIQATAANQKATFTAVNPGAKKISKFNVMVARDRGTVLDNAIIRFDEGNTLEKFSFRAGSTKLYFTEGNKDYAVVCSNGQGEMPVYFKAETRGTYTLSVKPENVEVSYLHLIDNLTGANVDLLANPSYTFEARTTDYASRFRLVFTTNADVEENTATETFAYFNGSEWVINGTGNATLQVIDVLGRVLRSEQINGNTAINLNQAAGIYMLRLINGENVMVQKVVVR